MRVLNTRPREQAAELSTLLRSAGFEVIEAPAIQVAPAWDVAELARVTTALRRHEYAWLVLSSANAAQFLLREIPDAFEHAPVLCGSATARSLRIQPALALERFSAAAALDALLPRVKPGIRVLVPRTSEGRDELVGGLEAAAVQVDAPVCYRTVSAPLPPWQPVDAIAVCSPSAVSALADAYGPRLLSTARIVCLGHTTASAATERGLVVAAIAETTSMHALVSATEAALRGVHA